LNAPANAIVELERQLKINEDVLRFMSVRVEAFEQSNSSRKREREDAKADKSRAKDGEKSAPEKASAGAQEQAPARAAEEGDKA
jgi:small subunit ribosomal protein S6